MTREMAREAQLVEQQRQLRWRVLEAKPEEGD